MDNEYHYLAEARKLARENLKEIDKLKKEIADMESDKSRKKETVKELEKLTSSSRDARKMYGDMTPDDITHSDVVLEYQNHFKNAFRNMPSKMKKHDKYKVWELCAKSVQDCFEASKEKVVDKMIKSMKESLSEGKISDQSEETYDLHRAFKFLLDEMTEEEIKKITAKSKDKEMMMKVLKAYQPEEYLNSLQGGTLC